MFAWYDSYIDELWLSFRYDFVMVLILNFQGQILRIADGTHTKK